MLPEARHSLLLVDDEPHVRSAMKRYLRAEPYDIVEAGGGAEALGILRRREVDVIITDLAMPEMNGLEFLNSSRVIRPNTIRIVMTGHADLDACLRAINEDAVFRFLLKPWDKVDLRFVLSRAVRQIDQERRVARLSELLRRQARFLEQLEHDHPEAFLVDRDTAGRVLLSDEELAELAG